MFVWSQTLTTVLSIQNRPLPSQGTNLIFLLLHFTIWYLLSAEEELGLIGIFYGQYMSEIADWLRSNNTLYNKCKQTFTRLINKFKLH